MIKSGIDKIIKQAGGLQKISPELYALSENYKSIQKAISPCIESIQRIQSLISPKIQQYALAQQRFIQAFSSPYIEIIHRNKKVLNELIMPLSLISKAMQPYINMVEKIQSNYSYIEELSKTISRFIEIERIDSMLLNDYWLIFDRDLINEIKDNLDNEAFNINKFIVRKYSYNKFEKIKELLDDIKQSECIKEERIPIIESCYTVMKQCSAKNACNAIIPTLTAQLEGILKEIIEIIPKDSFNKIIKEYDLKKESTVLITLHYLEDEIRNSFRTIQKFEIVIKDKAFGRVEKEDKKYRKSRHSILHGSCHYGCKENIVRAWLELAFLVKIKFEIMSCQERMLQEIAEKSQIGSL